MSINKEDNILQDNELIARIKNGDDSGFNELVAKYANKAYQIAYGLLSNKPDAEEVVQDAFMKVYKNLDKFRGDSSFTTWFYRIVTNLSRNKYHWNRRRGADINVSVSSNLWSNSEEVKDIELPDTKLEPDVLIQRKETESTLIDSINRLPEKLKEVILLRHIEELSYQQIADVLNCELGTVKSRLARAREALKVLFKDQ